MGRSNADESYPPPGGPGFMYLSDSGGIPHVSSYFIARVSWLVGKLMARTPDLTEL